LIQSHTVVLAPSWSTSQVPCPTPHSAHPSAPPVNAAQVAAAAASGWHEESKSSVQKPAQVYRSSTVTPSFFSHSRLVQSSRTVVPRSTKRALPSPHPARQ
jgi:hypothetical protein